MLSVILKYLGIIFTGLAYAVIGAIVGLIMIFGFKTIMQIYTIGESKEK